MAQLLLQIRVELAIRPQSNQHLCEFFLFTGEVVSQFKAPASRVPQAGAFLVVRE
jgi:hypothetical protein